MANFAEITNGIVKRVIVVHNNELLVDGVEVEFKGAEFCTNLFGGEWVQTSYNASTNGFRKQFAGVNYSYDAVADVFIKPQPYESWTLDSNHDWQPPVPMPTPDGQSWDYCTADYCGHHHFVWDEKLKKWVQIEQQKN